MKITNPYFDPDRPHHKPNGFRNPAGSPRGRRLSAELAREAAHFLGEMRRMVRDPYPFPDDHVIPEADALERYDSLPEPYRLTWIGHACFMVTFNGIRVLTDPYMSPYASPVPLKTTRRLVPAAIRETRLPPLDLILISHNHYDHLDSVSLKRLVQAHPQAQVVAPLGLKELLLRLGFTHITELDWYDSCERAGVEIQAVPAIHTSKRGIGDTNRSLWCGFRISSGDRSVYFAGDTAYGEVFQEIGARCGGFDLGLVPIGAYQPRILMKPVHCTPEEAIAIGRDIGARHLVGMHWGTIRLTTEPMLEPRDRFLGAADTLSRQVMKIGETISF